MATLGDWMGVNPSTCISRRAYLCGAAAAGIALPGCSQISPYAAQDVRQTAPPAEITFSFPNWNLPAIYESREQRKIEAFQRRFPTYHVTAAPVAANYGDQLLSLLSAGTPPHTFWVDHQNLLPYAKRGLVEELEGFARDDRSFRRNELPPLALKGLTYSKRLVGVAPAAQTNLYFFNADLFREAGLPTPYDLWKRDKWTWEAFLESALKLTRRDAGERSSLGTTLGLPRLWMNAAGGQEFDDEKAPAHCLYHTQQAMDGLQFRNDLLYLHKVFDFEVLKSVGPDETRAFLNGRLGSVARWTTGLDHFQAITTFRWGVAPYPRRRRYAADYTHWAYAMARGLPAEEQQAAWAWLRFYSGVDGQRIEAEGMTAVPFARQAQDVYVRFLQQVATLEHPEAIREIVERHGFSRVTAPDGPDILRLVNRELNPFMSNERDLRSAALAGAARADEYLRDHPQTGA
jgi:multiple sugar transport system substrate-binding protein